VTPGFTALAAHVVVRPSSDRDLIRRRREVALHERFGLDHTTLQVDHTSARLLGISSLRTGRRDR
jgi:cobalt-zinc-cadmium efflux system protein